MRSSRNCNKKSPNPILCCNRLENAVKPQLREYLDALGFSCNRLENAVKPQPIWEGVQMSESCNRLENAVKPQLAPGTYDGFSAL